MDEGPSYRIRRRAFELWEQAGRPEGKDRHFWKLAEEDIQRNQVEGNDANVSGQQSEPY